MCLFLVLFKLRLTYDRELGLQSGSLLISESSLISLSTTLAATATFFMFAINYAKLTNFAVGLSGWQSLCYPRRWWYSVVWVCLFFCVLMFTIFVFYMASVPLFLMVM